MSGITFFIGSPAILPFVVRRVALCVAGLCWLALTTGGTLALCQDFGPQTPRNISNVYGRNAVRFDFAPPSTEINLCNIHTHTNAEHMGPGFSVYAGPGENGGFRCSGGSRLTPMELTRPGDPVPSMDHDSDHGSDHGSDSGTDHAVTRSSTGHDSDVGDHDMGHDSDHGGGRFAGVEPGDTI